MNPFYTRERFYADVWYIDKGDLEEVAFDKLSGKKSHDSFILESYTFEKDITDPSVCTLRLTLLDNTDAGFWFERNPKFLHIRGDRTHTTTIKLSYFNFSSENKAEYIKFGNAKMAYPPTDYKIVCIAKGVLCTV